VCISVSNKKKAPKTDLTSQLLKHVGSKFNILVCQWVALERIIDLIFFAWMGLLQQCWGSDTCSRKLCFPLSWLKLLQMAFCSIHILMNLASIERAFVVVLAQTFNCGHNVFTCHMVLQCLVRACEALLHILFRVRRGGLPQTANILSVWNGVFAHCLVGMCNPNIEVTDVPMTFSENIWAAGVCVKCKHRCQGQRALNRFFRR